MRVKLNSKFYNLGAVKEALRDFREVCQGKILDNSIELELIPKEDIKNLKDEFCNYVLGLMKNKMLV